MNKLNQVLFKMLILLSITCIVVFIWKAVTDDYQKTSIETTAIQPSPDSTDKTYTVGWSVYNSDLEYFHTMQDGVYAKADELGYKVISSNQRSNSAKMVEGALDLINQGIDALIISPVNPSAMILIVESAKEKKIPVVVVDVGTGGTEVDAFILSDNFVGGIIAGEYALKLIKEHSLTSKNAAIIKVEETSTYARRRGEGFKRVLMESGYNIVAEVTANSETATAYDSMKHILEVNGDDLAVVFSENDQMALGAAEAIEDAGKKGQIMVIGFDGIPLAIKAIKNGLMQGTVAQQPFEMGELGVEVTSQLLNNERVIYDNDRLKELYVEVYLIDETGSPVNKPEN